MSMVPCAKCQISNWKINCECKEIAFTRYNRSPWLYLTEMCMWGEGSKYVWEGVRCLVNWSYRCNCSQKGGTLSAASPDNRTRWDTFIIKSHHASQLTFPSTELTTEDSIPSISFGPFPDGGIRSVWAWWALYLWSVLYTFSLTSLFHSGVQIMSETCVMW